MSEHGLALLGIKVLRSLGFLNRCIRPYVFCHKSASKKKSQAAFGGMRSRCKPLIQQLPTHKLEHTDQQTQAVKNSFWLVLNLYTGDY